MCRRWSGSAPQQAQQAELQKTRAEARRHHFAVEHTAAARQHRAFAGHAGRFFHRTRRQPRPGAGRLSSRVKIETPSLIGSISLKGARIDDLSLVKFRDTVDPASPAIVLYSPSGTAAPYYAEFGWVPAAGSTARVPDRNTEWQQESSGALTPTSPVVLKYDNGEGLTFRRTISVDERYLFTIKDDVSNVGNAPVTLYPFALISRHGAPQVSGYYILHEGLIGYLGDDGLQEYSYKKIDDAK